MRVVITYLDGTTATLDAVAAVTLVGQNKVRIQTFNNEPVLHRAVRSVHADYTWQTPWWDQSLFTKRRKP